MLIQERRDAYAHEGQTFSERLYQHFRSTCLILQGIKPLKKRNPQTDYQLHFSDSVGGDQGCGIWSWPFPDADPHPDVSTTLKQNNGQGLLDKEESSLEGSHFPRKHMQGTRSHQ